MAGGFTTLTGGLVNAYGVVATAILATGSLGSVTTTNVFAGYVATTGANVDQTLQAGRVLTPYLTVPGYADISGTGIYFTGSSAPNSGTLYCTRGVANDLVVPGVAELSSAGIMLTGGPTAYAKNINTDSVHAQYFYATGGGAQFVGGTVNVSDVSTYSLEAVTASVNGGTLSVGGAVSVSSTGICLTGPATYVSSISGPLATISSINCSTVSGGTGSFSRFTWAVRSLLGT